MDVRPRLEFLRAQQPHLRLYALVDGLVFEQMQGERLQEQTGCAALFAGTEDAALSAAGPWLVDAEVQAALCTRLNALQANAPLVSWLITGVPFDGLTQLLRLKLDVRLPGGRIGLLRFYDPRVLHGLASTLSGPQREDFFGHILEWHFVLDGRAMQIAREPETQNHA